MNSAWSNNLSLKYQRFAPSVYEFNEFKPRLKNRFQWSAGLSLEKINTNVSENNKIWAAA